MGAEQSVPQQNASVIIENPKEGEGDIHRSPQSPDKLVVDKEGNAGEFKWLTYSQVQERALNAGSGLLALGIEPRTDMIGLFSQNNKEWVITAQAANAFSIATVPLYDTLGANAVEYITKQAGLKVVALTKKHLTSFLEVAPNCKALKVVVQFGQVDDDAREAAKKIGIEVLSLEELEERGKADRKEPVPPKPDDLAIICYTSGTTGDPKGAMLSHRNVVADLAGGVYAGLRLEQTDVLLSYLPLAHMFERLVQEGMIMYGGAIGFYQGDVLKLFDDLAELKPTIFPSVPRLFNRVYDKITANIEASGYLKKTLFNQAFAAKEEALKRGVYTHAVWDALIFNKIRERLGGRVRLMVTGSAPIGGKVLTFLRVCFACPVLEGYGQTETGAAATLTTVKGTRPGNVGGPIACNEIKLVDVPEMGYVSSEMPPRGEVCFRGPNVFQGYYKNEEKTKEALDEDGWLHSGDIGVWNEDGTLSLIDRKKSILKLAQGEYCAPEKIENIVSRAPVVAQIFVHGDSLKSQLIAIVVPEMEVLEKWAKDNGVSTESKEALCANEKARKFVLSEITRLGKDAKLHGFELPKNVRLIPELFAIENNMLTATFKLKRNEARKQYKELIDEAYEELDEINAAKK